MGLLHRFPDAGQIRLYQLAFVNENHEFVFISNEPYINAGTPYLLVVEKGSVNPSPEIHPDKSRTAHKCADFSLPSSGHENKTFLQ